MTRLKELRLHGFKSFADPTRFVFERGSTQSSGRTARARATWPMPCAGSSASSRTATAHAARRRRHLRRREARRPQGMAEAILTLDNADGRLPVDFARFDRPPRVSLGRNRIPDQRVPRAAAGRRGPAGCRSLGANALVVVGQGTVDAALSLRPEERRQLFEEAAGVKSLQVRKNEALARLARSTRQPRPGRRPHRRAQATGAPARAAGAAPAGAQQPRPARATAHRRVAPTPRACPPIRLGEARRAAAAAEAALETHRGQQEAGRAAVEAAEAAYWAAEQAARDAAAARSATREDLIRAESRRDAVELRRSELVAMHARVAADLEGARTAVASLADGDAVDAVVGPAIAEATSAEAAWRAAITRLAEADALLLGAEEELASFRRSESSQLAEAARDAERRAAAEERALRLARERHDAQATLDRLADERTSRAGATASATAELARAAAAVGAAADEVAATTARRDAAVERLAAADRRAVAVASELDALRERTEHGDRLGARLASSGWRSLLDAVDAPEATWPAIEAVIGGDLDQALAWDGRQPPDALVEAAGGVARLAAMGELAADDGRAAALEAVGGHHTLAEWGVPAACRRRCSGWPWPRREPRCWPAGIASLRGGRR